MGKTSFSKRPQLCSPKPFFAFQIQFGQKFELPKKSKSVRPPTKIILKKFAQHRGDTTAPTQVNEAPQRKIAPKPLVLKFRVLVPLGVRREEPRRQTREKNKIFPDRKNTKKNDLQNGIKEIKNPKNPKTDEETWFLETAKNPFRATKQWFQKVGTAKRRFGGRVLTRETRKGAAS